MLFGDNRLFDEIAHAGCDPNSRRDQGRFCLPPRTNTRWLRATLDFPADAASSIARRRPANRRSVSSGRVSAGFSIRTSYLSPDVICSRHWRILDNGRSRHKTGPQCPLWTLSIGVYLKSAYRISSGLFEGISLQQSNESQASFETEQAITQQ